MSGNCSKSLNIWCPFKEVKHLACNNNTNCVLLVHSCKTGAWCPVKEIYNLNCNDQSCILNFKENDNGIDLSEFNDGSLQNCWKKM